MKASLAKEFDAIEVPHNVATPRRIAEWAYQQTATAGGYV
jgi:hypothetical protein